MTFTWISNNQYDIFNKLFGVPDYMIETPLVYDGIFIKNYVKTPLSLGFFKNVIYGDNVEDFAKYVDDYPIGVVNYSTIATLSINEINGIIELLSIVLFKKYNIKVDNVLHRYENNTHYFTPIVMLNNIYSINNININIDNFIGYVPFLSGKDLELQASDFIFLSNIDKYKYEIIDDIVCIKIGSQDYYELKAQLVENSYNDIDVFASEIRYYIKNNYFLMEPQFRDIMNEFIDVYGFVFVKEAINGMLLYEHKLFDKIWVLEAMDNINKNKLPSAMLDSGVTIMDFNSLAKLKYVTLRAITQIKNDTINRHLDEVSVASDGTLIIPILSTDNIDTVKTLVDLYIKNKVYVYKLKNESEGLNTIKRSDTTGIVFQLHDQWVLVTNAKTQLYPTKNTLTPDIKPLKELKLELIDLEPTNKTTQEEVDYLWKTGKLLTDWAYNYYTTYNKISKVPLRNPDDLLDVFSGN